MARNSRLFIQLMLVFRLEMLIANKFSARLPIQTRVIGRTVGADYHDVTLNSGSKSIGTDARIADTDYGCKSQGGRVWYE